MKTLFRALSLGIAAATVFSCTQKPGPGCVVVSEIGGLNEGDEVQLIPGATHRGEDPTATTTVSQNTFTLTVDEDLSEPRLFYIVVGNDNGRKYRQVMLENGQYTIQGDDLESATLPDCPADVTFRQKYAFRDKLDSIYKANYEKYKSVQESLYAPGADIESIQQSEAYQAMVNDEEEFFNTASVVIPEQIKQNGNTYWGPLLMLICYNYYPQEELAEYQAIFESFSTKAQNSHYGQLLKEQIYPTTVVGEPVPTFNANDRNGKPLSFNQICKGKKYILIDFWASWCKPCRQEIQNLKELYTQYASKGFEIYSVSIDSNKEEWISALDEEKLPWPNVLDENNVFSDLFHGETIPTLYLVDECGLILSDDLRGKALGAKLHELFD